MYSVENHYLPSQKLLTDWPQDQLFLWERRKKVQINKLEQLTEQKASTHTHTLRIIMYQNYVNSYCLCESRGRRPKRNKLLLLAFQSRHSKAHFKWGTQASHGVVCVTWSWGKHMLGALKGYFKIKISTRVVSLWFLWFKSPQNSQITRYSLCTEMHLFFSLNQHETKPCQHFQSHISIHNSQ